MEPLLDVRSLSFHYISAVSCLNVIDEISFQAFQGDFISIVGPSGCGKSTMLDILAGLMPASCGQVFFLGEPVRKPRPEIGYMLQKDHLFEWRTILKNALLGPEMQHISHREKKEAQKKAAEMLTRYELGAFSSSKPSELSGGMRQRAALIRTLATDPGLLLLDEPFSALDYQTRLSVSDDIHTIIRREGKTAILVSHDIAEAISMSDRVVVLSARPGTVRAIHDLSEFRDLTPMARRDHPKFHCYFNDIWKELELGV